MADFKKVSLLDEPKWMIYGATGYTGRLIAREAVRQGLAPILAGRNETEVRKLATSLGLQHRAFGCGSSEQAVSKLSGVKLVLHCAGPFSATSRPMVEACLKSRTHYLDITGEIPVFERILKASQDFVDAGIVAIPGVGFDVVPSDCLIAMLKRDLPDAHRLLLALRISGSPSQGTAKTLIEGLHAGIVVRQKGRLTRLPTASLVRKVRFWEGERDRDVVGISWGDVSTAFYSTGIENIETYLAARPSTIRLFRLSRYVSRVLARSWVQKGLKAWADQAIQPPGDEERARAPYYLWGRVENERGESRELRVRTPNGYSLTVDASLKSVQKVLAGEVAPGSWTPSRAFGADFLRKLSGVEFGP